MRRIAVIGGGITGLAAAHRLREMAPETDVTLLEAGPRLGGVLHTERADGYLLEHSADNFITNPPWAVDLCRRVGLGDELVETNPACRRAFVVRGKRLHPVPAGFSLMTPGQIWPLVTSPLLSWAGKLRVLGEYWIPRRREAGDESLASFARRRLGREAFERLVQPLVGGIYTADAEQLSMEAALPRFPALERQYGSLIRAARSQAAHRAGNGAEENASGARYSLFTTLRSGMSSLVEALAARLPAESIRLNAQVERLEHRAEGWSVSIAGQAPLACDAAIVALPAPRAANLLRAIDTSLSDELAAIPYAGTAIALVGYLREQVSHPLDGFGFVVPEIERRQILAASFSSIKFPGAAPDGHILVRVFLGGATRPELTTAPEGEIRTIVAAELGELLGVRGEPTLFRVTRWTGAMPQYHLGHPERVARLEARLAQLPNLQLAGNAYRGVGVPQCIRGGEQAAERLCPS